MVILVTTSYCEEDDLLLGQISTRLPPTIAPADFIENATNEINAKLGFTYAVPFVEPTDGGAEPQLPLHQWNLLRDIAAKLASGRIILAATAANQESTIHAYGFYLVKDAEVSLMAIANGDVKFKWPRVNSEGEPLDPAPNPQDTDPMAYIPGASNRDAVSPVETFENNYMTPAGWPYEVETWYPGA